MSAYQEYVTEFSDLDCLIEAICQMTNRAGKQFTRDMIEVHAESKNLLGYHGDVRPQKANVIIRGMGGAGPNNVGGSANDIGWEKTEEGKYRAHISEYDRSYYGEKWQSQLAQTYAEVFVTKKAKKAGYQVSKQNVDGKIRMKLTRWR
jgi:hypothetical protein